MAPYLHLPFVRKEHSLSLFIFRNLFSSLKFGGIAALLFSRISGLIIGGWGGSMIGCWFGVEVELLLFTKA